MEDNKNVQNTQFANGGIHRAMQITLKIIIA